MVQVSVKPSVIQGLIRAPPSKSYTHRALALSLLAESPSTIQNPLLSRDTLATMNACKAFGANVSHTKSIFNVSRSGPLTAPTDVIDVQNSGTTIRMMVSIASLIDSGISVLTGDESIRNRPMGPLLEALNQLGVECWSARLDGMPPIIVKGGGINGGETQITGNISSQFITSLLLTCPLARKASSIHLKGKLVSSPYVDSTIEMMKIFGGQVSRDDDVYNVEIGSYSGVDFMIPSDFSSASFLLASAALTGGNVSVQMKNLDLPQADKAIINILKKMGVDVQCDSRDGIISVTSDGELNGGNFDLSDSPDLLPVVVALALKAKEPVEINGVAHVRYKETDRLKVLALEISKTGAKVDEKEDGLIIHPFTSIDSCTLNSHNDHRMFMTFCLVGLASKHGCIVEGAESVDVSYPNFITDMHSLSAKIEVT